MARRLSRSAPARLTEFPLIQDLARRFGRTGASVLRGIGDDTAVLRHAPGRLTLVTTDLLAEGVHFDLATVGFTAVGYKAAVANLSDIAAMGGIPRYLLVSLAIPPGRRSSDVLALYQGLMQACRPHRVELVGGDTSASRQGLFLNLTVLGEASPGRVLLRSGARAGDWLYVTGTLGDSLAGLGLLKGRASKGPAKGRRLKPADERYLIHRHLHPEARVKMGQLLAAGRLATAAIDLSDGLSGDLAHLCDESSLGVRLNAAALPLSPALRRYAAATGQAAHELALAGGEDYEMLFAVPPRHRAQVERLAGKTRDRITPIGRFEPQGFGRKLIGLDGKLRPLSVTSYRHFEPPRKARG